MKISDLRELLRYDPDTGKLFWLPRDVSHFTPTPKRSAEHLCKWWNNRFANKEAFTAIGAHDAYIGKVHGRNYYAHIVIWALHYGEWPTHEIDHEDGNRLNNCISNLRDVTHQKNMQNKALYKSNNSGAHGVFFDKKKDRWLSYITVNRSRKHIGTFNNFYEAIHSRKNAEKEYDCFHVNHGRAAA